MTRIKTRFAPSPTGRMHVGNLRTALYSYLIAKHEGGSFLLRIEDTDQERFMEGALDIIDRTLTATGLIPDEGPGCEGTVGPYVQSERCAQGIYRKYAEELIAKGHAYYCFCGKERLDGLKRIVSGKEIHAYDKHCLSLSPEEIEQKLRDGVPHVIRFNMPLTGETGFHDEIYGDITVPNEELDDLILIKSDGYPTYNFANVVDDHLMGITHVVRGNEYLSSTPKYNRIYEAFGWEIPTYVHCPLITNEEGQKLSKRSGHSSFEDLCEAGYLKEAIVNFVALLGWSPTGEKELFSLSELIDAFDFRHINKSPAVFDTTKLAWMNGEYLHAMPPEDFYVLAEPVLRECVPSSMDRHQIAEMVQSRIQLISEIPAQIDFLSVLPDYEAALYTHKKSKSTPETARTVLQDTIDLLETVETFDNDSLFQHLSDYAAAHDWKINTVMWPIRVALSGKSATPTGATGILELLGKEESLRRLRCGLDMLEQADTV